MVQFHSAGNNVVLRTFADALMVMATTVALFRFGVLALVVSVTTFVLIDSITLTFDATAWRFDGTALVLGVIALLMVFGLRAALVQEKRYL